LRLPAGDSSVRVCLPGSPAGHDSRQRRHPARAPAHRHDARQALHDDRAADLRGARRGVGADHDGGAERQARRGGDGARRRAGALADRAPLALRTLKMVLNRGAEAPLETALELERKAYAWLRSTHDYAEGVTAFLEKRPPKYTGR